MKKLVVFVISTLLTGYALAQAEVEPTQPVLANTNNDVHVTDDPVQTPIEIINFIDTMFEASYTLTLDEVRAQIEAGIPIDYVVQNGNPIYDQPLLAIAISTLYTDLVGVLVNDYNATVTGVTTYLPFGDGTSPQRGTLIDFAFQIANVNPLFYDQAMTITAILAGAGGTPS